MGQSLLTSSPTIVIAQGSAHDLTQFVRLLTGMKASVPAESFARVFGPSGCYPLKMTAVDHSSKGLFGLRYE